MRSSSQIEVTEHNTPKRGLCVACHAKREGDAVVTRTIAPGQTGQIKFQGSWWTARCLQGITLIPGMIVHVIGRQTITLYVEPMFSKPVQGD
ncbi:MAG: NfeD family protein [Tildeniella nuda ZEHNDER 1965/U140]|nr:NfeD family protein [Tildeniella nuda ZEHNDER 1965/U140]